ncbi:MAG TPA: glycosyltransferase, partial [Rhodocyclaceae bacterium]|nr:glycosyltransferase [Rhodocyclaceae bacterium]
LPASTADLWTEYTRIFERNGSAGISYEAWIERVERPAIPSVIRQRHAIAAWSWRPRFSVLVPVYETEARHLAECLDSVLNQTYPDWELCIVDDGSKQPHVGDILARFAGRDHRVRVARRARNGGISRASNAALQMAGGDFVVLLDHDDRLAPHALFAVADTLQDRASAQLVYSDEGKPDESGRRCDPHFKPDWSPDLLYSQNYFSHLGVYRRELVLAAGGFRKEFDGSQDYDLVLRCAACVSDPRDIVHVPQVLYHWRKAEGSTAKSHENKDHATNAARRALQALFDAHHCGVTV